jgi:sugar phosphate isomerase/epimerase
VSPEHLHYLVRDLPQAMFTLDIGHAYVFNKAPENFAALLGPKRIGLMHVHDNHGAEDSHLPPGRGSIDWRNFLSYYLSQDCESPLFLETIGSEAEFREGRDFLIKIWEEALVKEGADERR